MANIPFHTAILYHAQSLYSAYQEKATPLHWAAVMGHVEVVKVLRDMGVRGDVKDEVEFCVPCQTDL